MGNVCVVQKKCSKRNKIGQLITIVASGVILTREQVGKEVEVKHGRVHVGIVYRKGLCVSLQVDIFKRCTFAVRWLIESQSQRR